ncbi:hypothetical protein Q428_11950 [Fervidicella metallireducens AeB]|uniref:Lipopolysaccharide biosynthesis protein n=1 Tax=Fervidicella metallireducens AeB TaxID=1403537 RepID=A0A017RSP3_9CLOT|nr:Wzz/FepE/Etk N-terminal domain-containing protein [Fervidicella metallireducens]EYE87667.1 hypothetical protein Q428_11950 [Fervidicella metallireducens AeB]
MEIYQILDIIKKRLLLLLLIPFLLSVIIGILNIYFMKPVYKASTQLIVAKISDATRNKVQYNDILMYEKLVKTYVEIAKSRTVALETIKRLNLDKKPFEVQSMITATPAADTQVVTISIKDEDKYRAALIANTLSLAFIDRVKLLMNDENIKIIDTAKIPEKPIAPNVRLNIIIAFFVGLILSLGLIFFLEYLDKTVKSVEEVEEYIKLPVIGIISKI